MPKSKDTPSEERKTEISPELKNEVKELVEQRVDRFISVTQKIAIALSVILGFIGYKSCNELQSSIKTEVKKELVNAELYEAIKTDVESAELEFILGILKARIEKDQLEDDDVRKAYLELFFRFFKVDEERSIEIVRTLNSSVINNAHNFSFHKVALSKTNLLKEVNSLYNRSENSTLRHECLVFLINFSQPEDISKIIDDIKKINSTSSSPLKQYVDEYLIQLVTNTSLEENDQIHKEHIEKLIDLSENLISKNGRDDITKITAYISLLKLEDNAKAVSAHIDNFKKVLLANNNSPDMLFEVIDILVKNRLLNSDEEQTSSTQGYVDSVNFNFKIIQTISLPLRQQILEPFNVRKSSSLKSRLRRTISINEEFYKELFATLYSSKRNKIEDKIKIVKYFTSTSNFIRKGFMKIYCVVEIKALNLTTAIFFNNKTNVFSYNDENGAQKTVDLNTINSIDLIIERPSEEVN
jgi:hypothetical protein